MDCENARSAISARLDGEPPDTPADLLREHLDGCADCRDWQRRAHEITRRARLGMHALDHDLTPLMLAALPPQRPDRRPVLVRACLVAIAVAQFAITVPLLVLGHDHDAGAHAAHELGSFDLALAIAFVVGALRPRLSAGLAWPCGVAAIGLAVTAIIDLIGGQTLGADEAQHLIAVAGSLLLAWQAHGYAAPPRVPLPSVAVPSGGLEHAADEVPVVVQQRDNGTARVA
jgi:predicted anti-sigma-YlaC factor YlaD